MVILAARAAGPSTPPPRDPAHPAALPGWLLGGASAEHPTRALAHVLHVSGQAGRKASVARGTPRLGPCMLWGFLAFSWSC